ncbi:hypothetical protein GCM10018966_075040 [Streptomyces yanii]
MSLALMGSISPCSWAGTATAATRCRRRTARRRVAHGVLTATFIVLIGFVGNTVLKEVPVRAMPSMMRRKKKPQPGAAGAEAAPAPQATEGSAGAPGTVRERRRGRPDTASTQGVRAGRVPARTHGPPPMRQS